MLRKYGKDRLVLITQFGSECSACRYSKSTRALHFHHVDSTDKHNWKTGRVSLQEVATHPERFVLICANCHAEEHDRLDRERAQHFNKCVQCGESFEVHRHRVDDPRRGKFCSHVCARAWTRTVSIASLRERFVRLTRVEGECLVWTGWICRATKTPVIKMPVKGKTAWATRSARRAWYQLEHGEVPPNKQLTPDCETPYCIAHTRLRAP